MLIINHVTQGLNTRYAYKVLIDTTIILRKIIDETKIASIITKT